MSRDLLLGLDGGGSKTILACVDRQGSIVALRHGTALDPMADPDWPTRFADLLASLQDLLPDVRRAVLGLPFHGEVEAISRQQNAVVASLLGMPCEVLNDVHVAFEGALAGKPGVLALAGTGSMGWAGDGRDRHIRVGGWGDLLGDEGSAHWVGREALSQMTQALDGRSADKVFADALLASLRIGEAEVIGWSYLNSSRRSDVAALAEVVDDLAETGNATALTILARAADYLIDHVRAAARRIGTPQPLVWSHAGGLFRSATVLRLMTEALGAPVAPDLPPIGGAILRAARQSGWTTDDPAWRARLAASFAATIRPGGFRHSGSVA
ncbi:N-acetylglucosamine kinase [Lichenihabitans sp. PAMC28606]|uniref:N-acetylglucosamine kinase n=1 Tax=Lichenihabitans sp. PAMC28606 TaxID=2880932 RepID=UPI001D0AA69B|nr:BadF/BadG/BcrA/BcrD ATPase family protein [Lichenihabitans sp. PAMC28606]UDL93393.1 N-acetylglucosamine kinase [Lichenihabitans sp. PAMC28606]